MNSCDKRVFIDNISYYNSRVLDKSDMIELFNDGVFSDSDKWNQIVISEKTDEIKKSVNSPLKKRMSQLSLGIYNVLNSSFADLSLKDGEIYLFTGFGEIETTNKIIKSLTIDKHKVVSPTFFHNSVHNTPLGYYTIINKIHNYCTTISDGMDTNRSFITFLKYKLLLCSSFVVAAGEEYSDFYKYDRINNYQVYPSFVSYRILPSTEKGLRYIGSFESMKMLQSLDWYNEVDNIFSTPSILESNDFGNKKLFTDYPVSADNPISIIIRLSMPFFLDIKGISLVIECVDGKFECFEVLL